MNRAPCDNALLAACHRTYGRLAIFCGSAGFIIGIAWYALVGLRAGA